MKKCDLLDLKDIQHIVQDGRLEAVKALLTAPSYYAQVYTNYEAVAYYVRINKHTMEAHIESTEKCRGYKLKKFLIECGLSVFKSDEDILSIASFIEEDNKALQLFTATMSNRVGKVNNRILYVSERQNWEGEVESWE